MRFPRSQLKEANSSTQKVNKYFGKVTHHSLSTLAIQSNNPILGIAYQRSPYDPFVNATQCQLDAALMKTLGTNAIRSITSYSTFLLTI